MTDDPFQLTGKRILVTGASSGIGRAIAKRCADLGAVLVCLGRNEDRLAETMAQLVGTGHEQHIIDVDDSDALIQTVEAIAASSPLSGIAHAAGVQRVVPLRVAKPVDFLNQYRTNTLSGAALLTAIAKRNVASPQGCSVVLIGSVMSVLGAAGLTAYCSAKAAVTGLVRAAALELAPARIRVNAILPGIVDTEMSRRYLAGLAADQVQAIKSAHPLGFGEPEDVAHAAAFLHADASRWITGTCLTVDGGFSAH
jgi:NAD(P)-dependent dehydrogenase (short-subunit alcohol dehydrogenase family)